MAPRKSTSRKPSAKPAAAPNAVTDRRQPARTRGAKPATTSISTPATPGRPSKKRKSVTPKKTDVKKAPSPASRKRKSPTDEESSESGHEEKPTTKRAKTVAARKPARALAPSPSPKKAKPTKRATAPAPAPAPKKPLSGALQVLVFGTGDCCELGLGPKQNESPKPRVNPYLDPEKPSAFHVSQFACGGMHTVALTIDNKIVTWGVNDNGALGRSTAWEGVMRDVDDESDEEDEVLNPYESTPSEVLPQYFPPNTKIVQVAAGDSCSLALTDTGFVYGWGTFLTPNGTARFGYDQDGKLIEIQRTPRLIPDLKNITQVACGANHALALDTKGVIWAWGSGHQNQLGKRLIARSHNSLKPFRVEIFRNKAKYIASGAYHSFAIDSKDNVWAWGLNGFGQAGDPATAGANEALLPHPVKIPGLSGKGVRTLAAGSHHSAAVTTDGKCLVWGRIDGGQLGIEFSQNQVEDESHVLRDERDKPRICLRPTAVSGLGPVAHVACSSGHTVFVTASGDGYATGLGIGGQLGNGKDDDADTPQPLKGKAVQDRRLAFAGAGGQFSVVAAYAE